MKNGWNPWHGCHKLSEGCANCYVYRIDGRYERDASEVGKNADFDLPVRMGKNGPAIPWGSTVWTCFSSDFFLEDADEWRADAWRMIARRPDLHFIIITKRIARFHVALPSDWGDGYPNVTIGCTCENQRRADERLPLFLAAPIKHRMIVCEPLLEELDIKSYLSPALVESVSAGGESGSGARLCRFEWIKRISADCAATGVAFSYHQTGALLEVNGRVWHIPRRLQAEQAKRAGVDVCGTQKE